MTKRIGTLAEFRNWTLAVVRSQGTASGGPHRWIAADRECRPSTHRGTDPGGPDRPTGGQAITVQSMVKLLSEDNLALLRTIAEREPRSVRDLADLADRKEGSVSRTLKKLAAAGIVRLERSDGRRLRPRLVADGVRMDVDFRGPESPSIQVHGANSQG